MVIDLESKVKLFRVFLPTVKHFFIVIVINQLAEMENLQSRLRETEDKLETELCQSEKR